MRSHNMNRETLERLALEAIPAEDYYILRDCLDETTDQELIAIIEADNAST